MSTSRRKAASADEAAARLIERVLTDAAFRAHFRRDPEAATREAGLDPVDPAAGAAFETLELRESKSSLAGAMMAAAVEGIGLYDLVDHLAGDGHNAVERALSSLGAADAHAAVPEASPDALALLRNPNVELDPDSATDLRAGRIDPRIVAVLGNVAGSHKIAVSNDHFARAVEIAAVDGQPVAPGNQAARAVAASLLRLDPSVRPTEIASPWDLHDPVAFTDADHQDRIRVVFDDPAQPSPAPAAPAPVPAPAAPAPAAAVDVAPGDDDSGDASSGDDSSEDDSSGDDSSGDDPSGRAEPGDDSDAEADDESDSDDDSDEEDDDGDDGGDGDDEDENEPDENEVGPDQDDLSDDERGAAPEAGDGSSDGDGSDQADDGNSGGDGSGAAEPDLGDVGSEYPGDDAPREQLALWMAAEAQRRGLPPELPVMAALVESGMQNLSGGDADSAGFFQMRAGIWDSGDYAGYPDHPDKQLDWFLDHADAVRKQRVAQGLSVSDPKQYGNWIADVERPAEQYRGRYQLRLADARELLQNGKRSPGAEDVVDAAGGGALKAGPEAREALAEARRYLGTPYKWGGSTPQTGFDCSGLVQWAYAKAGIRIPRVTDQQILAPGATKVGRDHLLPGDLVFFRDSTGYVHHVGISLGGKRFLHAPHTGDVVKISSLDEPYYKDQFTGGRRFDPAVDRAASVEAQASADDRASARAALDRDAAEVSRPGTALFAAVERQERAFHNRVQVLPAIRPDQVDRQSR
jgi:cell wall-associated NlpC family hydrolase